MFYAIADTFRGALTSEGREARRLVRRLRAAMRANGLKTIEVRYPGVMRASSFMIDSAHWCAGWPIWSSFYVERRQRVSAVSDEIVRLRDQIERLIVDMRPVEDPVTHPYFLRREVAGITA